MRVLRTKAPHGGKPNVTDCDVGPKIGELLCEIDLFLFIRRTTTEKDFPILMEADPPADTTSCASTWRWRYNNFQSRALREKGAAREIGSISKDTE